MKTMKRLILTAVVIPAAMIFAAPVKLHEAGALPAGCQFVGEVKVGDIAIGYRSRSDVLEDVKKEAETLGGNYVLADVKRVNHPKQGVYYWAWGTVGTCK